MDDYGETRRQFDNEVRRSSDHPSNQKIVSLSPKMFGLIVDLVSGLEDCLKNNRILTINPKDFFEEEMGIKESMDEILIQLEKEGRSVEEATSDIEDIEDYLGEQEDE